MAPCRESDCGGARTRCGSRRDTHGLQKKRGNHNNGAAAETQGVSQTGLMKRLLELPVRRPAIAHHEARVAFSHQLRRLGMEKLQVIDPRRRQSLLVGVLGHRFQHFSIVLDVVGLIILAHQFALLGDCSGNPGVSNHLRVRTFETLKSNVARSAKRFEQY